LRICSSFSYVLLMKRAERNISELQHGSGCPPAEWDFSSEALSTADVAQLRIMKLRVRAVASSINHELLLKSVDLNDLVKLKGHVE